MEKIIVLLTDFTAARAAWIVAKDQENPSRRLFLPIKNNLGNDQSGMAFELSNRHGGIGQPSVVWYPDPVYTGVDEATWRASKKEHAARPG